MCKCNDNIRSPWCGVGDCQMPKQIKSHNKEWDVTKETTYQRIENLQQQINWLEEENTYLKGLQSELLYYKGLNNLVESHNMMEELKNENNRLQQRNKELQDRLSRMSNPNGHWGIFS